MTLDHLDLNNITTGDLLSDYAVANINNAGDYPSALRRENWDTQPTRL